MLNMDW